MNASAGALALGRATVAEQQAAEKTPKDTTARRNGSAARALNSASRMRTMVAPGPFAGARPAQALLGGPADALQRPDALNGSGKPLDHVAYAAQVCVD